MSHPPRLKAWSWKLSPHSFHSFYPSYVHVNIYVLYFNVYVLYLCNSFPPFLSRYENHGDSPGILGYFSPRNMKTPILHRPFLPCPSFLFIPSFLFPAILRTQWQLVQKARYTNAATTAPHCSAVPSLAQWEIYPDLFRPGVTWLVRNAVTTTSGTLRKFQEI